MGRSIIKSVARSNCFSALLFAILSLTGVVPAQQRMTDKNVEDMMKNLKEDAKNFRSSFNTAVGKSTIRKTDQEKAAKQLVERFQKQREDMHNHFKDKKKADTELPGVRDGASQIDKLLTSTPLGPKVDGEWTKK